MSGEDTIGDYYKKKEKEATKKKKGKTIDEYIKNIARKVREHDNTIDTHESKFRVVDENFDKMHNRIYDLEDEVNDLIITTENIRKFLDYRIPSNLGHSDDDPGEFSKWLSDSGQALSGGKSRKKRKSR